MPTLNINIKNKEKILMLHREKSDLIDRLNKIIQDAANMGCLIDAVIVNDDKGCQHVSVNFKINPANIIKY